MTRLLLALGTSALLAGTALAQPPEATEAPPVLADDDLDGIVNHADPDFVRPGMGYGHGHGEFVDADGDGINDRAPDTDGDGIVNHLDDDHVRPGTAGTAHMGEGAFVDEDGDGINDAAPHGAGGSGMSHVAGETVRPVAGALHGGHRNAAHGPGTFVDADGDGINDVALSAASRVNGPDGEARSPGVSGEGRSASGRRSHGAHGHR